VKARYDVLQAELEVFQAVEQLQRARSDVETSTATFYTTLNYDPRPPLELIPPPKILVAADVRLADLEDAALRHRPEIVQITRSLQASRLLVKSAESQSAPSLTLGMGYNTATGSLFAVTDQVSITVNFAWPILDGGLRKAKVMEAKSQLAQLEDQRIDLVQQVRLQVEQAWVAFKLSEFTLATALKRAETASEFLDMTRARYINGLATSLEVQQSIQQLNEARQDVVVADANRNETFADLERASGLEIPDRQLTLEHVKYGGAVTVPAPGAQDAK